MASAPVLLFLILLSSVSIIAIAQERAPHGLVYENPVAFSPTAFEFFHPDTQPSGGKSPCATSNCSPLMPMAAATVQSSLAHESRSTTTKPGEGSRSRGRSRMGAGGIAGIVFGFVSAVFLTMGIYYVFVTRRANLTRTVQPDV